MRRVQLQQLLISALALFVFIVSSKLADGLSTSSTYDYTTWWGDTFWSVIVTIFVVFPSIIVCFGFVIAAIITEIKIYNKNRAKKV
jgi:hypothetical protein